MLEVGDAAGALRQFNPGASCAPSGALHLHCADGQLGGVPPQFITHHSLVTSPTGAHELGSAPLGRPERSCHALGFGLGLGSTLTRTRTRTLAYPNPTLTLP